MPARWTTKIAVILLSLTIVSSSPVTRVLAPSGDVLLAPTASTLQELEAPSLAQALPPPPESSPDSVQADCITEQGVFYGSDFLSTHAINTTSASDCCATCKLAMDCTVWNWCGDEGGCPLPPNLQQAGGYATYPYGTCIYKPRPITYGGTLPLTPTSNTSSVMQGWTSGIPINGSLLPALPGFELTTGIDLNYDEDVDYYCTGSSTTKPICQLYGNAKGAAAACIANPLCRGFQICWAFPISAAAYSEVAVIRLKAGPQAPLNITGALQNPYCSIYVLRAGAAASPNAGTAGYSIRDAQNVTAISAAAQQIANLPGRKLLQNVGLNGTHASAPGPVIAANATSVQTPGRSVKGTMVTTPFTGHSSVEEYSNVTFNYTQCYSNAPTIRVVIQSQTFPLEGPLQVNSIHSWTEVPFRNSGDYCCAFQDVYDYFLNLDTGGIAASLPMYVATNINLTTGPSLKNYDTTPASIVQPLVYLPANQISTGLGQGRQYTFPQTGGASYVDALEKLYFSTAQVALGNQFCTPGSPQLASAVNFLGSLLSNYSSDGVLSPGGIPVDMQLQTASKPNPDGSYNSSCLFETDAIYQGDMLTTLNGTTAESCCSACWTYYSPRSSATCDVWTLGPQGSCILKNSTLAANFQPVPATRNNSAVNFISGRRTAVLSTNTTQLFNATTM